MTLRAVRADPAAPLVDDWYLPDREHRDRARRNPLCRTARTSIADPAPQRHRHDPRAAAALVAIADAQEEERRSIARELHDEIGQVLTAIKVELSLAQQAIEAAGGPFGILHDARTIADGALNAARDLSHLLHPAVLDDLGLAAALDWYLQRFGRRHGVRARLTHEGMDARLSPHVETAVYRIVQEALTNVAKHARATECRVSLERLGTSVRVTIEDNGSGFDQRRPSESPERRGLGLVSIRERAAELKGTLRVESTPGSGTRLIIELPIDGPGIVPDTESAALAGVIIARRPREVLGG